MGSFLMFNVQDGVSMKCDLEAKWFEIQIMLHPNAAVPATMR